ncbi:hypothetical protein MAPG_06837 [Magnaporthiopsis poae ATCC 64411]|uniref:Uncharacterized protein n=1 Tax=Magnaporthiopsis poae (strain ATCC 64411 / 73-15) TaxID=644358 RepID=A0A0C4E345_MAGP6|nr:hypothetical protein MAPG_06837 [Magnaporthiopsis poae ATCC 64411]
MDGGRASPWDGDVDRACDSRMKGRPPAGVATVMQRGLSGRNGSVAKFAWRDSIIPTSTDHQPCRIPPLSVLLPAILSRYMGEGLHVIMSLPRSRAHGDDQDLSSRSRYTTNGGRISAALFRVPNDQEVLLAKEDAWAEGPSNQPGAPPNVPLSVLKGLEEFHSRPAKVQRPTTVQKAFHPPPAVTLDVPPRSTSRSGDEAESRAATPIARDHVLSQSIDHSPHGSEISWSQSPIRDRPTVAVHSVSASEASSPIPRPPPHPPTQPPVHPSEPHNFATQVQSSQIPISTATWPTLRSRVTSSASSPVRQIPKRKLYPPVPSSSVGNSEDELPLVLPRTSDWIERVTINRLGQPCPTPPSAQVIPCSEGQSKEGDQDTRKKRQRMQPLNSRIFEEPPEEQVPPSVAQEPLLPQKTRSPLAEEPRHKTRPVTNTPKVPPPATGRKPFEQFRATYPDYGGDLSTFLRTCLYLKYLEDQDELIPFLYDDFIRAFAHGFLPYIQNWKEASNPLPAIKWYNRNTIQPVYNQQVMDKTAVARVFDVYPGEIEHINEGLAGIETQTVPVRERSQPAIQTCAKERAEEEEDEPLENRLSRPRSPQATSMKPPSRVASGSRVQKSKQGVTNKDKKSLVEHFREAMLRNPHPRLTSSARK